MTDQLFGPFAADTSILSSNFWSSFGCDSFRDMTFRDGHTPNKKTRSDMGLDQVKMDVSVVNGSKSRCILVVLSLAKQPPRGPFARELRNQTGGNNTTPIYTGGSYTRFHG